MSSTAEARVPRAGSFARPLFLLATDLQPRESAWPEVEAHARTVAASCAQILGFEPVIRLAAMDETLSRSIALAAEQDASELFVIPVALDFNLLQRETIGRALGQARRDYPGLAIHHDDVDPGHPFLVECLAGQAEKTLAEIGASPQRTGLILAASGHGDASSRAHGYRLMRLLWERLGLAAGEIGFLRHERPFFPGMLESCAQRPLQWIVVPQMQWKTEHFQYAEVILENFQKDCPAAAGWRIADPAGDHPAMTALLTQRIARLWTEKRQREEMRIASPKRTAPQGPFIQAVGGGKIASVTGHSEMADLVSNLLGDQKPERILVKATWHGYATGTYTDPAALDLLLGALPAKAVIVEGHTSSRNLSGATFDWETQARENRAWIRHQDSEYLRRTGIADVLTRHGAQYLNVTEVFWDDLCAPAEQIDEILEQQKVVLHHPELTQFVPQVLFEHRGCPMISFAKFKGPTRLTIANMFGLLPEPLRAAWHGPNITYMARVCCDIVKLYGALFELHGIAEALYSAVRWNRQGLYRSRWGNYDLIQNSGYLTASRGLVSADVLASRLQGQDVNRSAFFDVVRAELGWDAEAATEPLPSDVQCMFT
jgi:sirohydrochlorin ferrochelatase